MKSVIVCEGWTDLTLIQFFMEKANQWVYKDGCKTGIFKSHRNFKKSGLDLCIGQVGGSSSIMSAFDKLLEANKLSTSESEFQNNIVIITDRDEVDTETTFIVEIEETLNSYSVNFSGNLQNDTWLNCTILDGKQDNKNFRVLLLVLPFDGEGALETFLLNAISEKEPYDKVIINKGNGFVDTIDPDENYLKHRRDKTKAKFDVYFSVRTPYEQFGERKNILKGIDWHKYELIQSSFIKLRELSNQ